MLLRPACPKWQSLVGCGRIAWCAYALASPSKCTYGAWESSREGHTTSRCAHTYLAYPKPQPAIPIRLHMLSRPLERDYVPVKLGGKGGDAAVGAVQLRPRLHAMDADALPCSERLPGCR